MPVTGYNRREEPGAAIPLLDHFHPPLSRTHPWRAFHGAWAVATARLLNAGGLPAGYYAIPFLDRDGPVEIDVATLHDPVANTGSPLTQPWTAPDPGLAIAVEWPPADDVRVEVLTDDGDPQPAAAVEFVSPRNKDRPRAPEAYAAKCAGYLSRGCGLVVLDVVTTRRADLHADLLTALGATPPPPGSGALSAVSYRPVGREADGELPVWPAPTNIGARPRRASRSFGRRGEWPVSCGRRDPRGSAPPCLSLGSWVQQ